MTSEPDAAATERNDAAERNDAVERDNAADTGHGASTDAWWVYILRCADGSLYTGVARDCAARLADHNRGVGAKYTRSRLPVALVYTEPAASRSAAQSREHAIKRLARENKLALIAGSDGRPGAGMPFIG